MTVHDAVREQLEEYVLGTLAEPERAHVRAHLAGCLECRHDVVELRRATDALPAALAMASPHALPMDLRDRVYRAIADRRIPPWRRPLAGAAAAIALVVLGSLTWGFAENQSAAQERELAQRLIGQQEIVFEIVDGRDTQKLALRAAQPNSTSYGKLYTRPGFRDVVVMTGRLPQPGAGDAYHLWVSSAGRERLAGTLALNQTGFGLLVFEADREGPTYEAARVTLQAKSATSPGGAIVLEWEAGR